ncbi:ubiquinone/menaquinone biosynthesis C-methyltransferase UbiE-like [Patiria miniata]|uniref:Methyltransferase domain-containing protein n=1 Tax=Patiria miniata TaxID=46514 RepID=A0A914BSG4_PATMI|nr:ubiquinone/menaquinone biosynthesis C-methyltransferase UbiE-like [Patiria miniata]
MANCEQLSSETAEEFLASMEKNLVGGMVGLGVAMGMETGLFDVMISLGGEPKTSQEIADAGNFKERYVREWLGCMTSARVVNFDPKEEKYWLPAHRSNITELKGLAMSAPILCGGFLQVAECFKRNGPPGVSNSQYPKFDELMELTQGPWFHNKFLQEFIPSMPQIQKQLNDGIEVLDAGCGTGLSTRIIAGHFPKSRFSGIDLSKPGILEAREMATKKGLSNVEFLASDITQLPSDWTAKFDYVFISFVLHDLTYPDKALREMHRVLKSGGTLSIIEVNSHSKLQDNLAFEDQDRICVDFTYSLFNCLPTSLVDKDGAGLGAFMGREVGKKMLETANFEVISITEIATESMHLMCKKP